MTCARAIVPWSRCRGPRELLACLVRLRTGNREGDQVQAAALLAMRRHRSRLRLCRAIRRLDRRAVGQWRGGRGTGVAGRGGGSSACSSAGAGRGSRVTVRRFGLRRRGSVRQAARSIAVRGRWTSGAEDFAARRRWTSEEAEERR